MTTAVLHPSVRAAMPRDLGHILVLLRMLHTETPHARLCEKRLREGAEECLAGGVVLLSCTPEGVPVGTLGLTVESPWFSDEAWLCDRWMFVAPAHRRTPHARNLLREAKALAAVNKMPLQMAVTGHGPRIAGKIRLFSRELGEAIGAIWNVRS